MDSEESAAGEGVGDASHLIAEAYAPRGLTPAARVDVRFRGYLYSRGKDSRVVLRLNSFTKGYESFVNMAGQAASQDWEASGFLVGRNGWYYDAAFSFEYTIYIERNPPRVDGVPVWVARTGHGLSTFYMANLKILGFKCHGAFTDTVSEINKIELWDLDGAQSEGTLDVTWS